MTKPLPQYCDPDFVAVVRAGRARGKGPSEIAADLRQHGFEVNPNTLRGRIFRFPEMYSPLAEEKPDPAPLREGEVLQLDADTRFRFCAMVETGSSPAEIALHFGIAEPDVIATAAALCTHNAFFGARGTGGNRATVLNLIKKFTAAGKSTEEIARFIGRTPQWVQERQVKLGLAKAKGRCRTDADVREGPLRSFKTPKWVPKDLKTEWLENARLVGPEQASALIRGLMKDD